MATPNDRFLRNLFIAIVFYSHSFCSKSAERKFPKKYYFVVYFVGHVWPQVCTELSRLTSQQITYQTTMTKGFFLSFGLLKSSYFCLFFSSILRSERFVLSILHILEAIWISFIVHTTLFHICLTGVKNSYLLFINKVHMVCIGFGNAIQREITYQMSHSLNPQLCVIEILIKTDNFWHFLIDNKIIFNKQ